jgi:hypothetical protein
VCSRASEIVVKFGVQEVKHEEDTKEEKSL